MINNLARLHWRICSDILVRSNEFVPPSEFVCVSNV